MLLNQVYCAKKQNYDITVLLDKRAVIMYNKKGKILRFCRELLQRTYRINASK